MDKSSAAARGGPSRRLFSRRRWLGATLGAGVGAVAAEAASLAGTWDHERPSGLGPRLPAKAAEPAAPRLTHVGHCCHLIEMAGQRWLTDPWFFDPAFGSLWHRVAFQVGAVGALDGIFISHRHADHFDPAALAVLDKGAQVWTADPGLLAPIAQLGFSRVQLSEPWQAHELGGLTLAFAPAVHDVPQHSLVLLGGGARLLFCADTGFHTHWGEIRRRYSPTTALLPCDGTALRWEPRQIMNPEEATRAAIELGCKQLLQTHSDAAYSDRVAEHLLSYGVLDPVIGLERALGAARQAAASAEEKARLPELSPLVMGETRALLA
jgi:L-ascorbate metabolism protein UlaG (beta-lactamase superfamily)